MNDETKNVSNVESSTENSPGASNGNVNGKVGYRRPPSQYRFKRGVSGNPRGRPKGSKSLNQQLEAVFNAPISVQEGVRKSSVPRIVVVLRKQIDQALKGDTRAQHLVLQFAKAMGLISSRSEEPEAPYDL